MGYIYVIHVTDTNIYKIGYTDSESYVKSRVKDFESKCHFPCELIKEVECDNASAVEAFIHNHFKDKNVKVYGIHSREVFRLSLDDCKELCEMISPDRINNLVGSDREKIVMYFTSINLQTGKVTRQETDCVSDWEKEPGGLCYPTEILETVQREKCGVWMLENDDTSDLEYATALTCFSIHSSMESLALCVEEYSIYRDIGEGAYCKRVRAMQLASVEWDEEWDYYPQTDKSQASEYIEFDWNMVGAN